MRQKEGTIMRKEEMSKLLNSNRMEYLKNRKDAFEILLKDAEEKKNQKNVEFWQNMLEMKDFKEEDLLRVLEFFESQKPDKKTLNKILFKVAQTGDEFLCRIVVDLGAEPSSSIITEATKNGNANIIAFLASVGVIPNDEDVIIASEKNFPKCEKALLKVGARPKNIKETFANAIKRSDFGLVKLYLEIGMKVTEAEAKMVTDVAIANFFLTKGVQEEAFSEEIKDCWKANKLKDAVKKNKTELVRKYLEEENFKPTADAAFHAMRKGNLEIIKMLIKAGLPVSEIEVNKAAENNYLEIVEFLLEKGAKFKTDTNRSVFTFLSSRGRLNIAKVLLEQNQISVSVEDLEYAVYVEKTEAVEFLIKRGIKPSSEALKIAIENENKSMAKYLLKNGAEMTEEIRKLIEANN